MHVHNRLGLISYVIVFMTLYNDFYLHNCIIVFTIADRFRVILRGEHPDYIHAVFAHVSYFVLADGMHYVCFCATLEFRMITS